MNRLVRMRLLSLGSSRLRPCGRLVLCVSILTILRLSGSSLVLRLLRVRLSRLVMSFRLGLGRRGFTMFGMLFVRRTL